MLPPPPGRRCMGHLTTPQRGFQEIDATIASPWERVPSGPHRQMRKLRPGSGPKVTGLVEGV